MRMIIDVRLISPKAESGLEFTVMIKVIRSLPLTAQHMQMVRMACVTFIGLLTLINLVTANSHRSCLVCPKLTEFLENYHTDHSQVQFSHKFMCTSRYTNFPNDHDCHQRVYGDCYHFDHRSEKYNGKTWWLAHNQFNRPYWVRSDSAFCNCCDNDYSHNSHVSTTTASVTTTPKPHLSLQACAHEDQFECQRYGDYAYTCRKEFLSWAQVHCPHYCGYCGSMHLVLQPFQNHGNTLLVLHNGELGSVCSDGWTDKNSQVVCRHLGLTTTGRQFLALHHQNHGYPILMKNIVCNGQESKLNECSFDSTDTSGCPSGNVVHLNCHLLQILAALENHDHGQSGEGMLLLQMHGGWFYMCASGWHTENSNVVCRMAGYESSNAKTQLVTISNSNGQGVLYNHFRCTGQERHLSQCPMYSFDYKHCPRHEYVHINCGTNLTASLTSNPTSSQSTSTTTRPITSSSTSQSSSKATSPSSAPSTTTTQTSLSTTTRKLMTTTTTQAVTTTTGKMPVKLVGAPGRPWEGRVEVFHDGQWGTVCDDQWDIDDAKVVCRSLGYNPDHAVHYSKAHFGEGVGYVWMDEVRCIGTEGDLSQCSFPGFGQVDCDHTEDAGVSCQPQQTAVPTTTTTTTTTPTTTTTSPTTKPVTWVWVHVVDNSTVSSPQVNKTVNGILNADWGNLLVVFHVFLC